jgi:hypothetical protein
MVIMFLLKSYIVLLRSCRILAEELHRYPLFLVSWMSCACFLDILLCFHERYFMVFRSLQMQLLPFKICSVRFLEYFHCNVAMNIDFFSYTFSFVSFLVFFIVAEFSGK